MHLVAVLVFPQTCNEDLCYFKFIKKSSMDRKESSTSVLSSTSIQSFLNSFIVPKNSSSMVHIRGVLHPSRWNYRLFDTYKEINPIASSILFLCYMASKILYKIGCMTPKQDHNPFYHRNHVIKFFRVW